MSEQRPRRAARAKVVVGVLTFKRTDRLATLLPLLPAQLDDAADVADARVVVVDNDPAGSARDLVAEYPWAEYRIESHPGIAAGRQRCLDEAADDDLLVFIDDDEHPDPGWLRLMVETWEDYEHPAGVGGSIVPMYASPPEPFVEAGGFFVRKRPQTGTLVHAASSANLLIDVAQARELGVAFDLSLGLRGGEDTLFTNTLTRRGGRIVFCREAVVHDLVPDARNNRAWVLQRAWFHGTNATLIELQATHGLARKLAVRANRAIGGLARTVAGQARAWQGRLARDVVKNAKGLRLRQRGAGMMTAALRPVPGEYSR